MLTFDDVLQMLQSGKSVELKFYLSMGLFSRHELSLVDGKIEDFSYVDDTTFTSTIEEYRNLFHGEAFINNAVEIEEIYER